MRLGAGRFVAGETLDECIDVLRTLDRAGFHSNTTLLGEATPSTEAASAVVAEYERLLDRIAAERLRANVALKLTHLGLAFDEEVACSNVARVVAHAARVGSFVRIDMEQSAFVDATLRIYERLRAAGHENVGTVLQSYLRRTPADLERLLPLVPNLRIVKGAYLEPSEIALPDKRDVDVTFVRLVERALRGGAYVAVATHDERLIRHIRAFAGRENIGSDRFELQMLYGVRPALQRELLVEGCKVLVATPFGPDWYPYLMRRLAERPANLFFFLKNLVRR
jgi:proline dehydrogenase